MRSYGPCRVISLPGETVEHLVFESRWTKGKWCKWYVCTFLHILLADYCHKVWMKGWQIQLARGIAINNCCSCSWNWHWEEPVLSAVAAAIAAVRCCSSIIWLWEAAPMSKELPLRGSIPMPAAFTVSHLQVSFQALWLYLCRVRYTCFSDTGCTSLWLQPFVMSATSIILSLPQILQGSLLALGCVGLRPGSSWSYTWAFHPACGQHGA